MTGRSYGIIADRHPPDSFLRIAYAKASDHFFEFPDEPEFKPWCYPPS
jgi:hypothetical protein